MQTLEKERITLNKEQKEAVDILEGPLLIVAGPGTGKTQLLSARAANIMKKKNLPGENMLILTYTNAAAKSVKERLARLVGFEGYRIQAETFHGFANSVVLDSEEASVYLKERIQMTDLEKVKCLEYIVGRFTNHVKNLRPFGYPYLYISDISKRISELKNEGITPDDFEKALVIIKPDGIYLEKKHLPRLKELAFVYKKYEYLKNGADKNIFDERGRYDYDDMIMLAIKILENEPNLKKSYRQRYKYIMVDEFQDTNGAQLKLLFLLAGEGRPNLCCVGDDDQSIYRFQGASIANFKMLKKRFPDISVVKLKDNYRSTEDIIKLSSGIIKQIPKDERLDEAKELIPRVRHKNKNIEFVKFSTPSEEIIYIVNKIKEIKKIVEKCENLSPEERKKPYNQIAVLVRKRSYILDLIDAFLKSGIPYATDGKEDMGGQKRVRQMISVLMLARPEARDPEEKDLELFRVLTCDFLEIRQADVLKFVNFVNVKKRQSPTTILTEFLELKFPKDLRFDSIDKIRIASRAINRLLEDADARPIHDILMGFVEDSNMYKFILKGYDKSRILLTRELRSLTAFINMVKDLSLSRPGLSLSEFLEELETMKTHNIPIEGHLVTATQDGVRIITAHASKGLEFHTCFIPFCIQDKSWPLKPRPDKLPLPPSVLKTKEKVSHKSELARLSFFDEARLFYVAASRARANLIFTSSPPENAIESSFFNNLSIGLRESTLREDEILKDFLKRSADENLFKETGDVLSDMVKSLVLTPTKLNNFLRCKRRFFYDNLLLLPGRKRQSLVFGNCTHKALEEIYGVYKNENKFPEFSFFENAFKQKLKFEGVNKAMAGWCLAKLPELKIWFEKTKINPVMPIDLEKKKIVTLKGGVVFSGKYDKVEFEDEKKGLIRVIDYKTGKPDDHLKKLASTTDPMSEECEDYLRQLIAYKMLYEKDTYEPAKHKVSHGVLVFLEPVKTDSQKHGLIKGDYVNKKVPITDRMVEGIVKLVGDVWKKLNRLEFDKLPEREHKKCNFCSFESMCWGE